MLVIGKQLVCDRKREIQEIDMQYVAVKKVVT